MVKRVDHVRLGAPPEAPEGHQVVRRELLSRQHDEAVGVEARLQVREGRGVEWAREIDALDASAEGR